MRDFRIGLAQIDPRLGDVEANLEKHLEYIEMARKAGCDLVVFPELSLTGYFLRDLVYDVAIDPYGGFLDPLIEQTRDITVVFGFVHETPNHAFKSAAAYVEDGLILHIHHKVYLVTYGLFDEGRYLAAGDSIRAVDGKFGRQSLLICEDLWHPAIAAIAAIDGADVIYGISCSPGRGISGGGAELGSITTWHDINRMYAQLFTGYQVYSHRVGYEDGVNFPGGSEVVGPEGEVLVRASADREELVVADLTDSSLRRARIKVPLRRDENLDLTLRELQRVFEERYG